MKKKIQEKITKDVLRWNEIKKNRRHSYSLYDSDWEKVKLFVFFSYNMRTIWYSSPPVKLNGFGYNIWLKDLLLVRHLFHFCLLFGIHSCFTLYHFALLWHLKTWDHFQLQCNIYIQKFFVSVYAFIIYSLWLTFIDAGTVNLPFWMLNLVLVYTWFIVLFVEHFWKVSHIHGHFRKLNDLSSLVESSFFTCHAIYYSNLFTQESKVISKAPVDFV